MPFCQVFQSCWWEATGKQKELKNLGSSHKKETPFSVVIFVTNDKEEKLEHDSAEEECLLTKYECPCLLLL